MKRISRIFFLFIIFFSFYCKTYSQNLNETLQWIKIAIETNTYSFVTFSSDSTQLIITTEPSGKAILGIRQSIPVKKIRSAQFVQNDDILRLELKCASEKCALIELKNKNDTLWTFNTYAVFVSILFEKGIDDNMKARIEKAFNHLITLQGESTLDKTF